MVDYNKLAATAKRLIDNNGRDISLRKIDRAPANALEPWRVDAGTDTTIGPFKGVIVPFKEEDIDGELIRRGDRRCLIAALDTGVNLIEQFDELLDGTDVWKIKGIEVINPGPVRVLYDLVLRR